MRRLRLKAVWLLIVPFFFFARPTPTLLALGGGLSLLGLAVRAWAAGTIHKERELTTTGPYAYTRNPLYVGSLLLGLGVTVAGGQWVFVLLFFLFYVGVYGRTMQGENALLEELFGARFLHYRTHVPAFLPRLTPYRAPGEAGGGFTWRQYRRNREWEAALGTAAGFALLAARMWWEGGG